MDAAEFDERIRRRLTADDDLTAAVHSLVRYGSFERGDFVPGRSDLDFFLVVTDDEVVDRVEELLAASARPIDHRGIDLAWEYRRNLGDPDAGVRFKFLTIYQADFRRHHTVVYGADVVAELPERDLRAELPARLDRVERLLAEAADEGDERQLRFLAGETARLRALLDGADSLRKADVRETLAASDRTDALRVYESYLDERPTPPAAFLRSFVAEETAAMRAALADGAEG